MPGYSGLMDGVHGEPYALTAGSAAPYARGFMRAFMQKRGNYGLARAVGGAAPATVRAVAADRADMTMRGGFDYATRTQDGANQVTVANVGGDVAGFEDRDTGNVVDAAVVDEMANTVRHRGYVADRANNGVTSKAWPEDVVTA